MNPVYKLISLPISIFSFLIYSSLALDQYFKDCEPIQCGANTITYPFYIDGQQKSFCGHSGFQVTCSENHTTINLSKDSYTILDIAYEDQLVNLVNNAFAYTDISCIPSINNFTLDAKRFKFPNRNHSEMIFLQNCDAEAKNSLGRYKELSCVNNNKTEGEVILYEEQTNWGKFVGKCDKMVSVPYEGPDASDSDSVIKKGFSLNWISSSCSECANSGGRCGYMDESGSTLHCFCPHGVYPYTHTCPKDHKLPIILGSSLGGSVLMLLAFLAIWHRKKLKSRQSELVTRSASLDRSASDLEKGNVFFGVPLFSYSELVEATDDFNESKELGDGGFGIVYYGKLKDGREVAIKRLYEKNYRRMEQFMNKIRILTCLRHQNLVSLYGCTSQHSRELLLVYEYVENGTVADHLYGEKAKDEPLPWPVRLRIAIETASALSYLHASDIVHRDVKTNNILLDCNFRVRVADFGLSRLFPNDVTHVSTAPQGTPGYVDPEYHQCYQLTDKSDVYSFGVVLIELISSLPAIDMNRHRHEINLSNYAMNRIQRCAFDELVDPQLGYATDSNVRKMTTMVAELAFQCLQHDKEFRPSMDVVLESLKRIQSDDSEGLPTQEVGKDSDEVVNMLSNNNNNPPASPIEDVHAQLLSNNLQHHPPSPISVMDKWDSRSTTHSNGK